MNEKNPVEIEIFFLSGESHRFPKRSIHSASHGLYSHMSRECAKVVRGQNEASDVESSGRYSGRLFASLHPAYHKALVLRREYQVSQREDVV